MTDFTVLHHFTSLTHIRWILRSGHLKTTESNVSLKRVDVGPRVVWLTTADNADAGHGLQGSAVDKARVRFTVRLPTAEVHHWRNWAASNRSVPSTIRTLANAGGSDTWRVIERPIPIDEWVTITDMMTLRPINPKRIPGPDIGRRVRQPVMSLRRMRDAFGRVR